ncbi:pyridoxal 5'-phosphate synthase glutaminase subunit PdxT [Myceligenerans pegani]|uniref:Pyridoxal 5'-phosphate synthase subunit PdxT n=1 Tax=Myceligenerans pegani TaxID=2776917 RepID=A0ABR9MZD8_9MICO|nr:pyridoxal 5'-phosphate synthase glutaminase subunit PdxT [Myceligenerans sp. TRM 65318]MBE1876768.1 pyridoxal 5'-phosphate synthase glutaminase subunit PdxT [Myceligenerans sp. TRM 65318]MBE3019039.1 pyridoxal 5'-phosphate synthase glutaminase subunit PdxT [Myceligenerans sp. TRM 65318]
MTRTLTVGVLALQGDVREHAAALATVGARAIPVRRTTELETVDGLVIPGGESTTIDKLLHVFGLAEPFRARIKEGLPVYGSCAGMILLADRITAGTADQRTLGGMDVVVRRNAFGRQVDSFETDLELAGISGGPVRTAFIRAPWIEEAGADVEVLARIPATDTSGRPVAAAGKIVAARQGPLLATAFHPEITGDARVHGLFARIIEDSRRS